MESVTGEKIADGSRILTVNTGSSSLKVTLYRVEGASEVPELSAVAERIGERSATVRERICDGLGFLGIALDLERNTDHGPIVSRDGSPVAVRVLPTDENAMIVRHTVRLIRRKGVKRVPF